VKDDPNCQPKNGNVCRRRSKSSPTAARWGSSRNSTRADFRPTPRRVSESTTRDLSTPSTSPGQKTQVNIASRRWRRSSRATLGSSWHVLSAWWRDAGGTYVGSDTDSMMIVATETGGLVPCEGGQERLQDGRPAVRALS